jgi:hypothetical protein
MPNPPAHREDQRDHQIALEVRRCRVLAELRQPPTDGCRSVGSIIRKIS